jgi:hypothetical protein
MKEMKTLNGYEVVDTQARADIEQVRSDLPNIIYSETEPTNPIEGMIWLSPAE